MGLLEVLLPKVVPTYKLRSSSLHNDLDLRWHAKIFQISATD